MEGQTALDDPRKFGCKPSLNILDSRTFLLFFFYFGAASFDIRGDDVSQLDFRFFLTIDFKINY